MPSEDKIPQSRPPVPTKPANFRVPPKPSYLQNTTVAEYLDRQKNDIKIQPGDGTKGKPQLYDVVKHGPPSFNGNFVMQSGDGGLVFKDAPGGAKDPNARLVHIPPAISDGLTKDKAMNKLITQSMESGQEVRFHHNADEWKVTQTKKR